MYCSRCGGRMHKSQALVSLPSGSSDFTRGEVIATSTGQVVKLIDSMKCDDCGQSVRMHFDQDYDSGPKRRGNRASRER